MLEALIGIQYLVGSALHNNIYEVLVPCVEMWTQAHGKDCEQGPVTEEALFVQHSADTATACVDAPWHHASAVRTAQLVL